MKYCGTACFVIESAKHFPVPVGRLREVFLLSEARQSIPKRLRRQPVLKIYFAIEYNIMYNDKILLSHHKKHYSGFNYRTIALNALDRTRTCDNLVNSQALYLLSYKSILFFLMKSNL